MPRLSPHFPFIYDDNLAWPGPRKVWLEKEEGGIYPECPGGPGGGQVINIDLDL